MGPAAIAQGYPSGPGSYLPRCSCRVEGLWKSAGTPDGRSPEADDGVRVFVGGNEADGGVLVVHALGELGGPPLQSCGLGGSP